MCPFLVSSGGGCQFRVIEVAEVATWVISWGGVLGARRWHRDRTFQLALYSELLMLVELLLLQL